MEEKTKTIKKTKNTVKHTIFPLFFPTLNLEPSNWNVARLVSNSAIRNSQFAIASRKWRMAENGAEFLRKSAKICASARQSIAPIREMIDNQPLNARRYRRV
jgi:hypothetical protein